MSRKKVKNTSNVKTIKKINKTEDTKKNVKENSNVPRKKEQMALIVIDQNRNLIEVKEVIKKIVKKVSIVVIILLIIAYIIGMFFVATSVFYVVHLKNGFIQKGVYINGIGVENLTQEQALETINSAINETIPEYIMLRYQDNLYQINLKELEVKFDVQSAVQSAYEIGRTKNVVKDLYDYADVITNNINIDAIVQYNDEILDKCIVNLSQQLPNKVQEYSYKIEGTDLLINKGKNGVDVDQQELKILIINNLQNRNYSQEIEIPVFETYPKPIDLQAIHDGVYKLPKDAYYTENPIIIHEQEIGVDFDIQNAQNIIDSNSTLLDYKIPLILTNPNIFVRDLNIFPDTLSTFSTNYVNNPNRTQNLRIASGKISGTVIMPGEEFSFNRVVGERTVEAGYKNAAIFVNGNVEDGLAGGICQVSSTLYNAVIGANLEIVERHNHSKLTSYLPGGKDATVVWGRYDFKFKNNRQYPIKIEMSTENGKELVSIYGIKSNEEYDIKIESGYIGRIGVYSVYNANKVYFQNGVEVKREFLSRDLYK